ncbi:lasso RiPP family leader peptide-containing protein [uncultured Jatrophihabitans sp.]
MGDDDKSHVQTADYEVPRIVRLGTLTELTQGGTVGLDDGTGGAGDSGSF